MLPHLHLMRIRVLLFAGAASGNAHEAFPKQCPIYLYFVAPSVILSLIGATGHNCLHKATGGAHVLACFSHRVIAFGETIAVRGGGWGVCTLSGLCAEI